MRLYIIRHAQSTNNASEHIDYNSRVSDPPLTDLGHRQAQALADYFVNGPNPEAVTDAIYLPGEPEPTTGYPIDELYCSPMHRTLQTASYLARATGLTPQVWVAIHEHGGLYVEYEDERGLVIDPGKKRAEILEEFPGYVLTDDITDSGWWTGGKEDLAGAYGRAIKVAFDLHEKAKQNPDARIAIVSHGTFIGALLKALTHTLPSRDYWYTHFNTAFSRVDFRPNEDFFLLRYTNRVNHLPLDLIS